MKSRDTIAATVGSNIRKLRLDRSQTLAGLAQQAGTSVRTLVEIESGRANASLATLGAIADALGVNFGRLTQAPGTGALRTVRASDAAVAWGDDLGSEARLILVSREPQSAELWAWLLKPGSRYQAAPDPEGTDVIVMVTGGSLALTVDGETAGCQRAPPGTSSPPPATSSPIPGARTRPSPSSTSRPPGRTPGTASRGITESVSLTRPRRTLGYATAAGALSDLLVATTD